MPSQIENKLVLVAWLAEQFGFKDNKDMLSSLKETSESWVDECHPALETILSRRDLHYERARLEHYDSNIRHYLDAINAERGGEDRIQLKYFQYLSMLMTETLLDNIAHNKERLIKQLNEFVSFNRELNNERIRFDESDLNKLAIWGATGCGKTLLMHLHYYQFLHYAPDLFKPMNILLITPNEALSAQHIQEMTKSGIPCARIEDESSLGIHAHPVRVIEITKIVKNRSGKGVSIPLERFESPICFLWMRATKEAGVGPGLIHGMNSLKGALLLNTVPPLGRPSTLRRRMSWTDIISSTLPLTIPMPIFMATVMARILMSLICQDTNRPLIYLIMRTILCWQTAAYKTANAIWSSWLI